MITYEQLVSRNGSYISDAVQQRIRQARILIAGCGVGSNIAETAVRTGFENLTLIDGDVVEAHNLNRQAFAACDVGSPKVHALGRHLRAINPFAKVHQQNGWLTSNNVTELVASADFIFDAIDLTSLEDIVALHDESQRQKKAVVAVFSIGWGAGAIYCPPHASNFREMMGLPQEGPVIGSIHGPQFAEAILRTLGKMDTGTQQMMLKSLNRTADGIPCPGHVAVGYSSVAALAITMAVRILSDEFVVEAPQLVLSNLASACVNESLEVSTP